MANARAPKAAFVFVEVDTDFGAGLAQDGGSRCDVREGAYQVSIVKVPTIQCEGRW